MEERYSVIDKIYAERVEDIFNFAQTHNLEQHHLSDENFPGKILMLSEPGQKLPEGTTKRLLEELERVKKDNKHRSCFDIAVSVAKRIPGTACLETADGVKNLIMFGNHCINLMVLSENMFLAADFKGPEDMVGHNGPFQVLALQGKSVEDIQQHLNELYGGDWKVMSPEKQERFYARAYRE